MERLGEQFIHQKEKKLHTSAPVEHEQSRRKQAGEKISRKPAEKLADWMGVLEKTHLGHRDNPRTAEKIRNYYHKEHVIKAEDVPESYFKTQQRLAREQGHGDVEISDKQRQELIEVVVADQESTLDNWIDYFMSEDSDPYPMWAKYWAFNGMLKLSTFDKKKHVFRKRRKGTVAPFVDLNREALAYVVDAIIKMVEQGDSKHNQDDPEFQKILKGANFGKLYAWAVEKATPSGENELLTTKGEWVKYEQGDDHIPLVESLQGHGTGWCTAGESTAKTQLKNGDFYVFYSHDKSGKASIPRVAIRMNAYEEIEEVRGIAEEQNLDPYIGDVAQEKLKDFGREGEAYMKKSENMKRLTDIDNRYKQGEELRNQDLEFLYQIDGKIQGFGYREDPRIEKILKERNIKLDLSKILGCRENQVSTTKDEYLNGDIKYHYGDLDLSNLTSADNLTLPEQISGHLLLSNLTSVEGLEFPKHVGGDIRLEKLTSVKELDFPKYVGGELHLFRVESLENVTFPEYVGDDINLCNLRSYDKLILPDHVDGDLFLNGIRSAKNLKLPDNINGDLLTLTNLISLDNLTLPTRFSGVILLDSLSVQDKNDLKEKHPNFKIKNSDEYIP